MGYYLLNHLKFVFNLQRYNEAKNLKNFTLISIIKYGQKHKRYDTQALHQLLRSLNMHNGKVRSFKQNRDAKQRKYNRFVLDGLLVFDEKKPQHTNVIPTKIIQIEERWVTI